MVKPIIDKKKCNGCGDCVRMCPYGVLSIKDGVCTVIRDACRIDMLCVANCPNKAITIDIE
ncbi:MAG: 4Fe-4S binding protein [Methanosarcinales archaeon]